MPTGDGLYDVGENVKYNAVVAFEWCAAGPDFEVKSIATVRCNNVAERGVPCTQLLKDLRDFIDRSREDENPESAKKAKTTAKLDGAEYTNLVALSLQDATDAAAKIVNMDSETVRFSLKCAHLVS